MFRSIIRPGLVKPSGYSAARLLSLKPNWSKFKKIPEPPGLIIGTVNEPYRIPLVSNYEGSYHWVYERIISFALIPMSVLPFVANSPHPMIDAFFSVGLLFHIHSGLKSCIIDYIPERVWGFWHKFAGKLLTLGTFFAMYGVYVIETANNGIYDLVSKLWSL